MMVALFSSLSAEWKESEKEVVSNMISCLLIKDHASAVKIGKTAIDTFTNSRDIKALYLQALVGSGSMSEALNFYDKEFLALDLASKFSLVETLAWGVLNESSEMKEVAKLSSLVGAYLTQDALGVKMLLEAMQSTNALLRTFAVHLASRFSDRSLQKEVGELLKTEKNWFVRMQLISAAGHMRLKESVPLLKEIIADTKTGSEEKMAAISSLVSIYDQVSEREIDFLLNHPRAGLRQFGLALIEHFFKEEYLSKIIPLLKDNTSKVRCHALTIFAIQGTPEEAKPIIQELMKDDVHEVAILASWVVIRWDLDKGKKELLRIIEGKDVIEAQFAASIVGSIGGLFRQELVTAFDKVSDPYVKVNLALSMLKSKEGVHKALDYIKEFLLTHEEQIMWIQKESPLFSQIGESHVRHQFQVKEYPYQVDQMTRLELMNILCINGAQNTKELVKRFLEKQVWGIATSVFAFMLQEGELESFDVIREFLHDPDPNLRLQAALALAFYGNDPGCVKILEDSYFIQDWDKKIQILEALGMIGNRDSIPFLIERMREPFQLIRTISASSVIQCLYH